jgi:adenylyltransferase/sulfurtransferase
MKPIEQGLERTVERAERFSRQLVLPEIGPAGCGKLERARVLVVGCGGLGTPVIHYLAGAGVGHLTLVDDDVVEISNLNRQVIHRNNDVGRPKAERAAEWVAELDPSITTTVLDERVSTHNARELVRSCELVLDCTDGVANKYLLNDACALERITLVHGAVTAFAGQIMVLERGKGPCLRCLFPEIPSGAAIPSCQEAGVLGAACGVVGSLMALEAIKLICGLGSRYVGNIVAVELFGGAVDMRPVSPDPDCGACGERPRFDARDANDYLAICGM